MPNSKLRKRRIEEQRKKVQRRKSSVNLASLSNVNLTRVTEKDDDLAPELEVAKSKSLTFIGSADVSPSVFSPDRAGSSSVFTPSLASSLSIFSFIPRAGSTAVSSAVDFCSAGLSMAADIVLPSRKLQRELESTKKMLEEAQSKIDLLEKTKAEIGNPCLRPPPEKATPAAGPPPPPPPPPGPPPPLSLMPKKLVIVKRSKSSLSLQSTKQDSRPLVTADDLKNIKLKPRTRSQRCPPEKLEADGRQPLISLDQLQNVRLKRSRSSASGVNNSTKEMAENNCPFAKRLRKVDVKRSPGGTPLYGGREKDCGDGLTPIITRALRRKFAQARPKSPSTSQSPSPISPRFQSPVSPTRRRQRSVRFLNRAMAQSPQ